jgi:2'-5' RNA ligase
MQKYYTSAVVIIPPEEIWFPIQAIRQIYDRNVDRWMPHITLIYPFRSESEFDDLEKKFNEKCSEIPSFTIDLIFFRYFSHKKNRYTIWISPDPHILIKKLQSKILTLVPDCNDVNKFKNGFTPHLSVGQFTGKKEQLREFLYKLQEDWTKISFFINKIMFIAREPQKLSPFRVKKEILLKK